METADLAMEIVNGELSSLIDAVAPYATGDETVVTAPCQRHSVSSMRFIHAGRSAIEVHYRPNGTVGVLIEVLNTAHDAHLLHMETVASCRSSVAGHPCNELTDDAGIQAMLAALGIV